MVLENRQFVRSDADLREAGYTALMESLGYADAIRFLAQVREGQGDYLELQERIFGEASVDELYERAEVHWKKQKRLTK
jgi:hypothetical protein